MEQAKSLIFNLPPQALDLEVAVLGAMINEKESVNLISLKEDDFYLENHQIIYKAILTLNENRLPIDLLTVKNELEKLGKLKDVGGVSYLMELTNSVGGSSHIEYHSKIIKQKSISRKLINCSSEVQKMAFDNSNDISEIIDLFDKSFTEITSGSIGSESFTFSQSINDTLKYISKIQSNREKGIVTQITTGLRDLDNELNGGWSYPDLVILGGRPSMGKTQFAVHFAKNAGINKHVLFCSLEMTKEQLLLRMITEDERISFYNIKTGNLTDNEWNYINVRIGEIERLKINISDSKEVEYINNIKSLARKKKRDNQLDILIIDYLQLIKTTNKFQNRDIEVGHITRELKSLAKELNIPIILLAQLNRPMKGGIPKAPTLEDLRESGNIEQDADIVIFPHRPSYYDIDALDDKGESWKNRGGLIMAKNREGERNKKVLFKHDERFKKIIGYNESFTTNYIDPNKNIEPNKEFDNEVPF